MAKRPDLVVNQLSVPRPCNRLLAFAAGATEIQADKRLGALGQRVSFSLGIGISAPFRSAFRDKPVHSRGKTGFDRDLADSCGRKEGENKTVKGKELASASFFTHTEQSQGGLVIPQGRHPPGDLCFSFGLTVFSVAPSTNTRISHFRHAP